MLIVTAQAVAGEIDAFGRIVDLAADDPCLAAVLLEDREHEARL
jgi:hypothetical protein